ncbi:MAG: aldehyde dehydrogenase [Deltaproteobacteria bacterium]|nr:aldehyde dehydrogenase [Deltaproteobacteria bacterium]
MPLDHAAAIQELDATRPGRLYINGEWRDASDGLAVTDPATGKLFGQIGQASPENVSDAVAAAREAYCGSWRKLSPGKRREAILRLAALTEQHAAELNRLLTLEMGVPAQITSRLGAISLQKNLEYFAGWMDKIYGEVIPVPGAFDYAVREPIGVVGAIIPWNTPLLFVGSKLGPALATGNTVVLKPSELASLAILRWAEKCLAESGIPPGVVNIVTGDGRTGSALAGHPGIDKLSFTGSVDTGRKVAELAGRNLTKVHMELGGKSPTIIFKDANLTKATMQTSFGIFGLSGQTCAACSRVYVEDPVYEQMVGNIASFSKGLAPGDPLKKSTILGPLAAERQLQRVQAYIEAGKKDARLVAGGERLGGDLSEGFFLGPTVFADVKSDSVISREEIFGPVVAVTPFKKTDEAIELANGTEYGLAAGIWTENITTALKTSQAIDAGVIWINSYGSLPAAAPFGGMKKSGYGRDGGRDALLEYTQVKNVFVDLA